LETKELQHSEIGLRSAQKTAGVRKAAQSGKIKEMDPTPMGENENGSIITGDEATFADRLIDDFIEESSTRGLGAIKRAVGFMKW
jgi:hypothetical protein